VGYVACVEHLRNAYKISARLTELVRSVENQCVMGEFTLKINLVRVGWEDMKWIHLAQDRNQWQTI
jgi:hypothetical protein